MATPSSHDEPLHPDLVAPTGALGEDPFADAGLDDSEDAELVELMSRVKGYDSGHEKVSSLSALSAQLDRYRPLPPPEQDRLVAIYNNGMVSAAELAAGGRVSGRRRSHLEQLVRDGDEAQTELIGSMFRLVLVISRELASRRYGRERSLDMLPDLVGAANLSLVEAVAKYDPDRGPAFSVYAGRVVRERVRAALTNTGLINIPTSWLRVRRLATIIVPELTMKFGRSPDIEEIQDALREQSMAWAADHLTDAQKKLPVDQRIELMKAKLVKQGMIGAIDRYEEVMTTTQAMWNLDAPVGSDGSARLGDLVADTSSDTMFDPAELDALRTNLFHALSSLPDRDREIVLFRFGFVDGEQWTYAKLAPRYKISAERVRQIERAALDRLRGPGFEMLDGFLPA